MIITKDIRVNIKTSVKKAEHIAYRLMDALEADAKDILKQRPGYIYAEFRRFKSIDFDLARDLLCGLELDDYYDKQIEDVVKPMFGVKNDK